ncbi:MAG: hypothetical protein P4L40_08250 [Terracidiphilus sp.]|nr:hypothetical protein [Terracidiphilus sp.]
MCVCVCVFRITCVPPPHQVRATIQDGSGIETIPFQVINGTLATVIDVVPAAPSAATRYELWFGGSTTPGGSLYMELDACSGPAGYIPTMYICGTDCPKPATPNDPSNSGAATVLSAGASGSAFNFRTPPADVLYASVVALSSSVSRAAFPLMTMSESLLRGVEGEESAVTPLPHMRQLNVHNLQPWRRELPFSQFLTMPVSDVASVTYLLKGAYLPTNSSYRLGVSAPQVQLTSAPPAADGHEIMGFEVTWDAAMLYDFVGGPPRALQGVQYTVYYSSGGFPANTVPTTACGLSQSGSQQQVLQSGTHLITDNLLPDTLYEVNVVAYCGDACQAAANIASPSVLVDEIAYAGASIKTPKVCVWLCVCVLCFWLRVAVSLVCVSLCVCVCA